ncbi:endoplasmic reticulum-based factor for assembly of v-ATPase domain-containing protein [Hirsutella rhossiliensis]|uniref:Endoplasmic reticulum-based factor for assembly of v-ATPase domain-containing protein n=1 Tax=Hirsutella rhossiliensis TaxID=111463 RepID=A0A9P8ML38_9HYPO|nr:endoplasmic reticulum-based factor for assembly of v-ATPase domain-containing protein [Hirsutella rhossiliensis]KAH0958288.1 endoplasmic reticulum-based factor for assembly of v-ATPase domain-containing protein [Hirsutella rhossiliensis]
MTPSMVDGLKSLGDDVSEKPTDDGPKCDEARTQPRQGSDPSLTEPAIGRPISHGQVVDLWKRLQSMQPSSCSLDALLKGSRVYVPPPPPKPEPSDEYKALMAHLRREEAERAYQRMVDPRPRLETFSDRFPTAAQAFAEVNRPANAADIGDDDVTYSEVHRQVMLIINFLVSIVGVAATLWVAARWWSLPARVFLSLGGAIAVAIAEVGVYQGYVFRMSRAKSKQKAVAEVKEVVKTWVVGQGEGGEDDSTVLLKNSQDGADETVRRRRPPAGAYAKPDD